MRPTPQLGMDLPQLRGHPFADRDAEYRERARRPAGPTDVGMSRPAEFHHRHRVARGGRPPPAPTERSVQFSRTTLVRRSFTASRGLVAPRTGDTALVAPGETAP